MYFQLAGIAGNMIPWIWSFAPKGILLLNTPIKCIHSLQSVQLIFKLFSRSPLKDLLWLVPELGDSLQLEDQKKGGRLQLASMEESLQRQRRKNKKFHDSSLLSLFYMGTVHSQISYEKCEFPMQGMRKSTKASCIQDIFQSWKRWMPSFRNRKISPWIMHWPVRRKYFLYTWDCIATVV